MLAAMAAVAVVRALPSAAAREAVVPPGLAAICAAAASTPLPARLGRAAAAGRTVPGVAASLLARLGPGAAADWRGAVVASGRRDIAGGDQVEVLGRPLMRTEADVLALGVLIRDAA